MAERDNRARQGNVIPTQSNQRSVEQQRNRQTRDAMEELQRQVAILSVLLMIIGGFIIALAIIFRRSVRLISNADLRSALFASNYSIAIGIFQIVNVGFCCFTAIWELKTPIRLSMITSVALIGFETGAITLLTRQALNGRGTNEKIYRAWYVWECFDSGSCQLAYDSLAYKYMLPEIVMIVIAGLLQVIVIRCLFRFLSILNDRQLRIWRGMEDLRTVQDSAESSL